MRIEIGTEEQSIMARDHRVSLQFASETKVQHEICFNLGTNDELVFVIPTAGHSPDTAALWTVAKTLVEYLSRIDRGAT